MCADRERSPRGRASTGSGWTCDSPGIASDAETEVVAPPVPLSRFDPPFRTCAVCLRDTWHHRRFVQPISCRLIDLCTLCAAIQEVQEARMAQTRFYQMPVATAEQVITMLAEVRDLLRRREAQDL